MESILQNTTILLLVLLTGLSAGLCFTWSNSITSGIGKLNDLGYLQSFQQLNRSILNPLFFFIFFGPFFINIINLYLFKDHSNIIIMLGLAAVIYFLGVIVITIFGNVPLNELLDKIDLNTLNNIEIKELRMQFELKWNRLHMIRTVASFLSFLILSYTILKHKI